MLCGQFAGKRARRKIKIYELRNAPFRLEERMKRRSSFIQPSSTRIFAHNTIHRHSLIRSDVIHRRTLLSAHVHTPRDVAHVLPGAAGRNDESRPDASKSHSSFAAVASPTLSRKHRAEEVNHPHVSRTDPRPPRRYSCCSLRYPSRTRSSRAGTVCLS